MGTEPVLDTDPTIGRLVTDASRDISSLISKEIQLAKSELKVSVKAGGVGIGLFAAAGFIAVLAVIMLSVAIAYLINWNGDGPDLHWAFLIVFGFYLLVAGLLVLAVIMLSVAIAYLINWNGDGLELHWAFLIVFAFYVLLAALLVFVGIKKVKQVGPPDKAIAQGKLIPDALKGRP